MTEQQFLGNWYLGLIIAGVVVVIVAVLVGTILITARRILDNANRALKLAHEINANTQPIWELDQTNQTVEQLLQGAQAIEGHASQIADTLDAPVPQR